MRISPSAQEVAAYSGAARFAVLQATLHADIDTPISAFARLADGSEHAFLLESAESGGRFGRWSFMGGHIAETLELRDGIATWVRGGGARGGDLSTSPFDDPLLPIRERLADWTTWEPADTPPFSGGAVGYIGFDCMRYFEPVPLPEGRGLGLPDAALMFCDEVHAYDHLRHRIVSMVHIPLGGDRDEAWREGAARLRSARAKLESPGNLARVPWPEGDTPSIEGLTTINREPQDMRDAVAKARAAIGAGETFQVVVSQRISVQASVDPFVLYRALRALNPSPYMFLLRWPGFSIVGASPEVLVRVQNGELLVRPIAGTRKRGRTDAEDRALEDELRSDQKEIAEHRMLLDLGRNDAGRVAEIGTVRVEDEMHVERYSHVMHLVSDVHAKLARGYDMYDALRACFPAGTVSGAPKVRACELLAELEPDRRGPYAGAIGYFGVSGDMDTAIAIRTLVVQPDSVHVQAGAGVVWDSDPERERVECLQKAQAPLVAVRQAIAARGRHD